ncbi:MAG TPA: ATP phosphoribosyltransferase regulatory subunit [Clostridiales bacterium]|nr:ATP phosphoribosyltransferase regulatory subunit [Clostridiales bacterium]
MGKWSIYTPDGIPDILFKECREKRVMEERIRHHLMSFGYQEIETPTIEFYDVFDREGGLATQEAMFKFFDQEGRILVLRPDFTVPVARIAATRLKEGDGPCRVFYVGNAFRYDEKGGGKRREFTQAGVELLGAGTVEADAEVIARAVYCLKAAGLKEFQIDIGQVEFFKGLMEEAGIHPSDAEEIRILIDKKDFLGLKDLVRGYELEPGLQELILELPRIFGPASVLERLAGRRLNQRCRKALRNLTEVYEILKEYGLVRHVSIDLGMVSSLNYYTGLIFKGFTLGVPYPVLSGGRYDTLLGTFGKSWPATGFSMGINLMQMALGTGSAEQEEGEAEVLIIRETGQSCAAAFRLAASLQPVMGRVQADVLGYDLQAALHFARNRRIPWIAVAKAGRPVLVRAETGQIEPFPAGIREDTTEGGDLE